MIMSIIESLLLLPSFSSARTKALHELEMVQTEMLYEAILFEEVDTQVEERATVGQMVQREGVEVPAGHML